MVAHFSTTDQISERLAVLLHKLEVEGMYARASTVWLAIEEIKRLSK